MATVSTSHMLVCSVVQARRVRRGLVPVPEARPVAGGRAPARVQHDLGQDLRRGGPAGERLDERAAERAGPAGLGEQRAAQGPGRAQRRRSAHHRPALHHAPLAQPRQTRPQRLRLALNTEHLA